MIGRKIVYLRDFAAEAEKLRASYGSTTRFSSGDYDLDRYLGGGYGRQDGYEIVLVFGSTGVGKSMVSLNLIADAARKGDKIGMLVLEDDGPDVFIRFTDILGPVDTKLRIMQGDTIHFMPPEDMQKSWKLTELLEMIEEWFMIRNLDLIFLDHLQFAFEGAEAIKGENEYIAQRVFMQKLNQMMKRIKKTIIIVSHTNKSGSDGMGKIVGSGSIAQAATKVIEVQREDGDIKITMHKSRFTRTPDHSHVMTLEGAILRGKIYETVPGGIFK